jgi:hypothetical protein
MKEPLISLKEPIKEPIKEPYVRKIYTDCEIKLQTDRLKLKFNDYTKQAKKKEYIFNRMINFDRFESMTFFEFILVLDKSNGDTSGSHHFYHSESHGLKRFLQFSICENVINKIYDFLTDDSLLETDDSLLKTDDVLLKTDDVLLKTDSDKVTLSKNEINNNIMIIE